MPTIKDILNGVSFILTIVLVSYGLTKGYDLIELSIYNIYFIVQIITLLLNIIEKKGENL